MFRPGRMVVFFFFFPGILCEANYRFIPVLCRVHAPV